MSKKYTDKEAEQIIAYALSFHKFYREKKLHYPTANIEELAELFLMQCTKDDFVLVKQGCNKGNPLDVRCEEPSLVGRELVSLVHDTTALYHDAKKLLRDTSSYLFAGSLPEKYRKRICKQEGWDETTTEAAAAFMQIGSGALIFLAGFSFSSLLLSGVLFGAGVYAVGDAVFRGAGNSSPLVKYLVRGIEKIKGRELFPEKQQQQLLLLDLYHEEEIPPPPKEIQTPPELAQNDSDIIFPDEEFPCMEENADNQTSLLLPENEHIQKAKQIVKEIDEKIGKSRALYRAYNSEYASLFTPDNGLMLAIHALLGEQQKADNILSAIDERIGKQGALYKREKNDYPSLSANASMIVAFFVLGKHQEAENIYTRIPSHIGRIGTLYLGGAGGGKIYVESNALMAVVHSFFDHEQEAKKILEAIEKTIGTADPLGKGAFYIHGHNDYALRTGSNVAMALAYYVVGETEKSATIISSVDAHMEKEGSLYKSGLGEERCYTFDNAIMAILSALHGGAKLK